MYSSPALVRVRICWMKVKLDSVVTSRIPVAEGEPLAVGRGCGKLYLVGEYAVMDSEGAAVIAGVNRFVTATAFASADGLGRIYSSYYADSGRPFEVRANDGQDSGDNVSSAVHVDGSEDIVSHTVELTYLLLHSRGETVRPLVLDIVSNLDDEATGKKYGLGSSGAVSVAVIDAIARAHRVELSRIDAFKTAYVATLRAGARGSGGDIACSSHGGVVLYRRPDMKALLPLIDENPLAAISADWPGLELESRADLAGLSLCVGWTGQPVKTDDQLAAADAASRRATPDEEAVVKRFPAACAQEANLLWRALEAGKTEAAMAAVRRTRELLRQFAEAKHLNIETELLGTLADIAEAHGAVGKSSGSGGGDCGIALAPASVDTDKLEEDWATAGIEPLDVSIAPMATKRD